MPGAAERGGAARPARRFDTAATGGTFDTIHRGHVALLDCAFGIAGRVVVGVTGDGLAASRGKSPARPYAERSAAVGALVSSRYPGRRCEISRLDDVFGPAALERRVGALVVSAETEPQGAVLNGLRAGAGLPPVEVVVVPMVRARDGERISTTRIRGGEIDGEGRILDKEGNGI